MCQSMRQSRICPAVALMALFAAALAACNDSKGDGKNRDGGGDLGGGSGINVTFTIVGEGSIAIDGTLACSSATDPCTLNVPIGSTTSVAATPGPGYAFESWSCSGQLSTKVTLDLTLQSGAACVVTFIATGDVLTVAATDGAGGTGGVVTSSSGGLSCGTGATVCSAVFDTGEAVTLTATPDPFFSFVGWSGDCTGTSATTAVAVTGPTACTATFARIDLALQLGVTGQGSLTATVAATTLQTCTGNSCAAILVPAQTTVTITATPGADQKIASWGGDCAADPSTTVTSVTMEAARTCLVTFAPVDRVLVVAATGGGTVTRSPTGTPSGSGASYTHGTIVQLDAVPDSGRGFLGWSGDCSGTALSINVTMDANKSCTATFGPTLTVAVVGSGSVTSSPSGIDSTAGKTSAVYAANTTVTLTAVANTGGPAITFEGWTGACSSFGTTLVATVTLDDAKSCTATFTVTPYDLTVVIAPTGGGTVTGKRNGTGADVINCGPGTDCDEAGIPSNETIVLTATALGGYRFDKWSGCSTATTTPLTVAMNATKSCTANFVKQWTVTLSTLTGPGTVTIDRASTLATPDQTCSAGACAQIVDSTETTTVTATPSNSDAIIEAFSCTAGTLSGATYTITNPTANVTCTVTFRQRYTITVTTAGVGATASEVDSSGGVNNCGQSGGVCSALYNQGTTVTLTARPAANYRVVWSASGSGVCDGAVSNGTGEQRIMTFTSLAGAKDCTATFSRITHDVTVAAVGAGGGSVASAPSGIAGCTATGGTCASTFNQGDMVVLTATAAANYTAAFSSTTGSSCNGTPGGTATVATMTFTSLDGAKACTVTFTRQYTVTVKIIPAPTASTHFGTASAPCTISSSQASCTGQVASGGTATLTAAEAGSAAKSSRFVGWQCSNGFSATTLSASLTNVTADVTCVARFYGLWSRYYRSSSSAKDLSPSVVDLPIGFDSTGLPSSSSQFVIEGWRAPMGSDPYAAPFVPNYSTAYADGLIAADNEVTAPAFTSQARTRYDASNGGYIPYDVASDTGDGVVSFGGASTGASGRVSAMFWPMAIGRAAATGLINSFSRGTPVSYRWADLPFNGTFSVLYDSLLAAGAFRKATSTYAVAGIRTATFVLEDGTRIPVNAALAMTTDTAGTPSLWAMFNVPSTFANNCVGANALSTSVADVMWDPDANNPGGLVLVGTYLFSSSLFSFVAKLDADFNFKGVNAYVPSGFENLSLVKILPNLSGDGYALFGTMGTAPLTVAMLDQPFDLSKPPTVDRTYLFGPSNGYLASSFGDAVVDSARSRYVAAVSIGNVGSFAGTALLAIGKDGSVTTASSYLFGSGAAASVKFSDLAYRVIMPRDGGFLFTASSTPNQVPASGYVEPYHYWATRTDESFNVPFNGTTDPRATRSALPLVTLGTTKYAGSFGACAAGFDTSKPSLPAVAGTNVATFSATVNVQAP